MSGRIDRVRLGGTGIEVTWDASLSTAQPLGRLLEQFADEGEPDLRLQVVPAQGCAPPVRTAQLADHLPDWRVSSTAQGHLYEIFEQSMPHRRAHWALVDAALTHGTVWWERGAPHIGWLLQPLLQLLLLARWQSSRTYMVHGLAVDDQGAGRVFIGASGTGKTTLARWYHAAGATVLSDEHVILRLTDAQLFAYGTPWPGLSGLGSPRCVPVASVCFLAHAPAHALEPLATREIFTVLYPQLFLSRATREDILRILHWCEAVQQVAPVMRLHFARDPQVLDYIRQQRPAERVGTTVAGGIHV